MRKKEFVEKLVSCFMTLVGCGVEIRLEDTALQLLGTDGNVVSSLTVDFSKEPEFMAGLWYSQL